jgi:hypothetical protein
MPRLIERDDVMRTAVNLGRAKDVWSDEFVTDSGEMAFKLPQGGRYQVVFVRIESKPEAVPVKRRSAVDMIGYGRKFHKLRTTDEWMKELREGEED